MVRNKQKGVVLIISLVFLVALTGVATALLQNSTTDLKMSGASEDKTVATQEVLSAADEVIYTEVNKINGTNVFTNDVAKYPVTRNVTDSDTKATISVEGGRKMEVNCPHSKLAFSIEKTTCNVLTLEVTREYGRNKNQKLTVNAGIVQLLLDGDG